MRLQEEWGAAGLVEQETVPGTRGLTTRAIPSHVGDEEWGSLEEGPGSEPGFQSLALSSPLMQMMGGGSDEFTRGSPWGQGSSHQ